MSSLADWEGGAKSNDKCPERREERGDREQKAPRRQAGTGVPSLSAKGRGMAGVAGAPGNEHCARTVSGCQLTVRIKWIHLDPQMGS